MTFALLSAAAPAAPTRLDPVELFLQADIIVQAVMVGLILASVWVWMIIVSFSLRIGKLDKASREYEGAFWSESDTQALVGSANFVFLDGHVEQLNIRDLVTSTVPGDTSARSTFRVRWSPIDDQLP